MLKMENGLVQRSHVDAVGVGRHVAAGQDLRVSGQVNRPDLGATAFPLLRDPGRSGKEVKGGAGTGPAQEGPQGGDEPPFGTDVLDHRRPVRRRPP